MEIFNKILHSYVIYCHKEMVKTFKCYLIPKKSYDTLSKGQFFLANPIYTCDITSHNTVQQWTKELEISSNKKQSFNRQVGQAITSAFLDWEI